MGRGLNGEVRAGALHVSQGKLPAEGTARAEGRRQDTPGMEKTRGGKPSSAPAGFFVSRSDLGLGVASEGQCSVAGGASHSVSTAGLA